MKQFVRTAIILAGLSGTLALVGCVFWRPIGDITVQPQSSLDLAAPEASKGPGGELRITAYVTGWVEAPANILIDQSVPSLPSELQQPQWVPSVAYTVEHPVHGIIILDAGLRTGDCDYGLRPFYWVSCRNSPGSDLVSQLKAAGIQPHDIRYIIPSHFHGDHISGLGALLSFTDAPLLVTEASLREIRSPLRFASGISSKMLKADMNVILIDPYLSETSVAGLGLDVFADGSLVVFPTSGHSDGHMSALARTGDDSILLTFDASHLAANMELGIPSGAVASKDDAIESLSRLRQLAASNENLRTIYGHEPSQWACVESALEITAMTEPCSLAQENE